MELIFVLALVVGGAWLVLSGSYKSGIRDPETLRAAELEDAYIDLKKKLLVTSAYEQERRYQHLYNRIHAVLGRIVKRHEHFVRDVEARSDQLVGLFQEREHYSRDGMKYKEHAVPSTIRMDQLDSGVLLYLCFFLWHGGHAKRVGSIESDPQLMSKILEYLVGERWYPAAFFFKGLVLKYGVVVYESSRHAEARQLLEAAQQQGVGAATIELEHLGKYSALEGIKNVHSSIEL